jgi:pSer/pThr/pTyr-binding forkhead associated (FHA) protein
MEEVHGPTEAHPLQGPHRDPELPAGFSPLRLMLEPNGVCFDVQRPEAIVGRHSSAEVRLALPDISRRHCRVVFENQQWRVYDLNSLNGVFVNGERMEEATLYDGDRLQVGECTFVVNHNVPVAVANDDNLPVDMLQSIAEVMKEQKWAS